MNLFGTGTSNYFLNLVLKKNYEYLNKTKKTGKQLLKVKTQKQNFLQNCINKLRKFNLDKLTKQTLTKLNLENKTLNKQKIRELNE